MRYKKFLLIPVVFIVLVFLYVNFINSFSSSTETVSQGSTASKSRTGEVVGIGHAVTVKITRATKPYLFGLVDLPAHAQGIGSLTELHTIFFWSLYALTAILTSTFIIIERRGIEMKSSWSEKGKSGIWMKLGKAVGIGALFALVSFLISGDASSLPLGLLVAYLEFRFDR